MHEGTFKEAKIPMQGCMGIMEEMEEGTDKSACPMAAMCKGMMEKSRFWFLPMIPGVAFILGGVLIFIEPTILFWILGGTSIIVGLMMMVYAIFIRRHFK